MGPPLDSSRDLATHIRDVATTRTVFGTTHPSDHPTSDAAALAAPSPRLVATAAATEHNGTSGSSHKDYGSAPRTLLQSSGIAVDHFFLFALLFPVPSAGDILAVLFSSYFILISVADA